MVGKDPWFLFGRSVGRSIANGRFNILAKYWRFESSSRYDESSYLEISFDLVANLARNLIGDSRRHSPVNAFIRVDRRTGRKMRRGNHRPQEQREKYRFHFLKSYLLNTTVSMIIIITRIKRVSFSFSLRVLFTSNARSRLKTLWTNERMNEWTAAERRFFRFQRWSPIPSRRRSDFGPAKLMMMMVTNAVNEFPFYIINLLKSKRERIFKKPNFFVLSLHFFLCRSSIYIHAPNVIGAGSCWLHQSSKLDKNDHISVGKKTDFCPASFSFKKEKKPLLFLRNIKKTFWRTAHTVNVYFCVPIQFILLRLLFLPFSSEKDKRFVVTEKIFWYIECTSQYIFCMTYCTYACYSSVLHLMGMSVPIKFFFVHSIIFSQIGFPSFRFQLPTVPDLTNWPQNFLSFSFPTEETILLL